MTETNDPKNDADFARFMRTVTEHVPPSHSRETPYGRQEQVRFAYWHLAKTLRHDETIIRNFLNEHGAPLIDAIVKFHKSRNMQPPHEMAEATLPPALQSYGMLPLGELERGLNAKPNYRFREQAKRMDSLTEEFLHGIRRLSYRHGDFSVNYGSEYDMRHRMAEAHLRQSLGKSWVTNVNRMTHYNNEGQKKMIEAVMKLHQERGITPADDSDALRALFHEKLPHEIAKLRMPDGAKPEFVTLAENPNPDRSTVRGT